MAKILVSARDLRKNYGSLTAVDGISFEILEGECFGFLGPNGAGKTTTVKMIHCVSPLTSGTLTVNGLPARVDNRALKKMTGIIPQEMTLDVDLTVYENLIIFAKFFDIPKREARKRIAELLQFVELEAKRCCRISQLSTGMKRRLLVARALLNHPKLIVADEPTTGLDPQARHLIWQRLRRLKSEGVTLILTTQYMEEAQQLCDRIVVMHQGKILKEGVPATLVAGEIGREVVEVRVPQEEDARIVGQLAGFSCGHERVGVYFYCRDGQGIEETRELPTITTHAGDARDVFPCSRVEFDRMSVERCGLRFSTAVLNRPFPFSLSVEARPPVHRAHLGNEGHRPVGTFCRRHYGMLWADGAHPGRIPKRQKNRLIGGLHERLAAVLFTGAVTGRICSCFRLIPRTGWLRLFSGRGLSNGVLPGGGAL
jgi:lipooligosaccharide transport system ATP-binding protein